MMCHLRWAVGLLGLWGLSWGGGEGAGSAWMVVGPFDDVGVRGPERELDRMEVGASGPKRGGKYRGKGGAIRWEGVGDEEVGVALGDVDVGAELERRGGVLKAGAMDGAVAYFYRAFVVERERVVHLRIGSDEGRSVWLNGELVHEQTGAGWARAERSELALQMRKGVNHVLIKVINSGGRWLLSLEEGDGIDALPVAEAIERGVDFLVRDQWLDGSWSGYSAYGAGYTAFACYVLLRCGLWADHPAIRRGLAYVDARPMKETYGIAVHVLLLAEVGGREAEIRDLVDELVHLQESNGLYGYPVHPAGNEDAPADLSNTLFAALAFRAAERCGVKVHARVWKGLIDGTLAAQEAENEGARGFAYRLGERANGSMTTAGMSVLLIAKEALGKKLERRADRDVERALDEGLLWLDSHMDWTTNPAHERGWFQYYFYYGLERLGSLLGTETLGNTPWYRAGAEYLMQRQSESGTWGEWADVHGNRTRDTLPALLFLSRATAPISGETRRIRELARVVESGTAGLAWRVLGRGPYRAWVTGVGPVRLDVWRDAGSGEPRLVQVRYERRAAGRAMLGAWELVANVTSESSGETRGEVHFDIEESGVFELRAVATYKLGPGIDAPRKELTSEVIELTTLSAARADTMEYPRHGLRNLLRGASVGASSHSRGEGPLRLVDGLAATSWRSADGDSDCWVRAELPRAVVADRLLLTHAFPAKRHALVARASRVEIRLDGTKRYEATLALDSDRTRKSEWLFPEPTRVRIVEVRVTDRVAHGASVPVGFAEIELLLGDE